MKLEQIVNEALTSPIYHLLDETPLTNARKLSASLGSQLLLKREDLQPIFSFKVRGAYHKLLKMPEAKRKKGLVAASAGNHAQGVAYSAKAVGVPAYIYMPALTPSIKVEAVESLGAKVKLKGASFAEALELAKEHSIKHGQQLFHPFDDLDVIAGQATLGAELLREMHEHVEAVFIACGGGGLLAGVAAMVKHLRPKVKIFGVEPTDAASMHAAFRAGKPVTLPYVGTFAETVAVARAGNKTFKICKDLVDDILLVDSGSICNAIKDIYEDTRTIVEPAGALGVAGARAYVNSGKSKGGPLVAVVCGANMNFDSLRYVIERTVPGDRGEMLLGARIPERPGSFLELCQILGKRHVTEFNYRYSGDDSAHIFAGIVINEESERRQIIAALAAKGIKAVDLSGDETAELHIRHMVGGRAPVGNAEQVYRFEFPERSGALEYFLRKLHKGWNISLFHYRFHGADVGRVLVGFQLPPAKRGKLEKVLDQIGYPYWPVNGSKAYEMFLADPARVR